MEQPTRIRVTSFTDQSCVLLEFAFPRGAMAVERRISPSGRTAVARSGESIQLSPGAYTLSLRSLYSSGKTNWLDSAVTVSEPAPPGSPVIEPMSKELGCGLQVTPAPGAGAFDQFMIERYERGWKTWRGPLGGSVIPFQYDWDASCGDVQYRAFAFNRFGRSAYSSTTTADPGETSDGCEARCRRMHDIAIRACFAAVAGNQVPPEASVGCVRAADLRRLACYTRCSIKFEDDKITRCVTLCQALADERRARCEEVHWNNPGYREQCVRGAKQAEQECFHVCAGLSPN